MTCHLALSPIHLAEHFSWCFILAGQQVGVWKQGGQVAAVLGQGQVVGQVALDLLEQDRVAGQVVPNLWDWVVLDL